MIVELNIVKEYEKLRIQNEVTKTNKINEYLNITINYIDIYKKKTYNCKHKYHANSTKIKDIESSYTSEFI